MKGLGHQPNHSTFNMCFLVCLPEEHSGTEALHNSHQRDQRNSIQKLMGVGAEFNSQTFSQFQELQTGGERRIGGTRGERDTTRTLPTESTDWDTGSMKLSDLCLFVMAE